MGYVAATPLQLLNRTANYLHPSVRLLEGEGFVAIRVISNVISYISKSNSSTAINHVCRTAFLAIDRLLQHSDSVVKETVSTYTTLSFSYVQLKNIYIIYKYKFQHVNELQRTVKQLIFVCKKFLPLIDSFFCDGYTVASNIQPINKFTNLKR